LAHVACEYHGVSVQHQPLLLVQARNLITNLALPALLTDPEGRLLFFNDAAAALLGRSFEEVGRLSREEWAREVGPFDEEGQPLAADSLPLAGALRGGRPAQGRFRARLGESGMTEVELSALPLLEPGNFEGALVVFWPVEAAAPDTT
jgi:PAS domain-containing protein